MENIGGNLMEGMYLGIVKGAAKTLGAVKEVANGVVSTASNAISGVTGGSNKTTSKTSGGGTTSTGGRYLNQTGELMNKQLDTTKGTDPCSKNSRGKCIGSELGGAIPSGLAGLSSTLAGIVTNSLVNDATERRDFLEKVKDYSVAQVAALETSRRDTLEFTKDMGSNFERWNAITRADTLEQVKDQGYIITSEATARLTGLHNKAWTNMQENVVIVGGFVQSVLGAVMSFIGSYSNSKEAQKTTQTKNTNTTTTQITNNFNNTHAGQQNTWDTENMHFWV